MKARYAVLLLLSAFLAGCLFSPEPEDATGPASGKICFLFSRSSGLGPGAEGAIAEADSVAVSVYHPGNPLNLEAQKAFAMLNQGDSVVVSFTVSPEKGKKVAVELFERGGLIYFGLDDSVDVYAGKTTSITIDAFSFVPPGFTRDSLYVVEGRPFTLMWGKVPGADKYRLQMAGNILFSPVLFDTTTPDTSLYLWLPQGKYFFRVAAVNEYTQGSYCPPQMVYAYSAPRIAAVSPGKAARGESIVIFGESLDYPGTAFFFGDASCQVVDSRPEMVTVVVPLGVTTDYIYVQGKLGSASSPAPEIVQLFAYVSGPDAAEGDAFAALVETCAETLLWSSVKTVPYAELDSRDMSVFPVILVGYDTGTDGQDWGGGVPERALVIATSEAQILGLGRGGSVYFDLVGLDIGFSSSDLFSNRSIFVFDTTDNIYNDPNKIPIPPTRFMDCYNHSVGEVAPLLDPINLPVGVKLHARKDAFSNYYPLVEQEVGSGGGWTICNFLWGFEGSVSELSPRGRACMVNVLNRLLLNAMGAVIPRAGTPSATARGTG